MLSGGPIIVFRLLPALTGLGSQGTEFGFAATDGDKDSPTSPPTPPGLEVRPY